MDEHKRRRYVQVPAGFCFFKTLKCDTISMTLLPVASYVLERDLNKQYDVCMYSLFSEYLILLSLGFVLMLVLRGARHI